MYPLNLWSVPPELAKQYRLNVMPAAEAEEQASLPLKMYPLFSYKVAPDGGTI